MLQLISPIGLWALAALALPLAIHLWRPPPRTVRLGSLRFLEHLPRCLNSLRWGERTLLAARLGLLALLALLLAGPRWQRTPSRAPQRWLLVDPAASPNDGLMKRMKALLSAGYEMRELAAGFPVLIHPWVMSASAVPTPDLWSLLREADAELPSGSSLAVFSPGRVASLRGSRPAQRHCQVEWIPTEDTPAKSKLVKNGSPAPPDVLVLHDADRADDARHLAAAIHAAGQASVRIVASDPKMGYQPSVGWLFVLGAQPVPSSWTEHGANVVSETAGDASRSVASWIVPAEGVPDAAALLDPVRLWQRTPPMPTPSGGVWWTDGFGQPLLTMTHEGQGKHWRFAGRFAPAWTDLPRGGAFPAWLRRIMFAPDDAVPDQRLADPSQCRPEQTLTSGREVTLSRASENAVDLRGATWMLAAVLFGVERGLSHRRRAPAAAPVVPTPEPAFAR